MQNLRLSNKDTMALKKEFLFIIFIISFIIFNLFLRINAEDNTNTPPIYIDQKKSQEANLNQLTLKQALEEALKNNKRVKSAIATLPVSEANLIIAKYIPNPVFGPNIEFVKQGSIHPVQIGQTFELGRKRYWRIQIAKEQISKTELEIAKVLWETHTQVHGAYAAFSLSLDLYDLADRRTNFYKSLVEIAEKKFEAGDISKLELNRAKLQLLDSENNLSEFNGRLKKQKSILIKFLDVLRIWK